MVDDSPEDIALVTATMVRHDANIVIDGATNIAGCLEALDKNEYDLLLIDYELSAGEDGLELIAKVKERDLDIPIIFMTGWGSEKVAADAFRQGVVDYFVKEVDYSYVSRLANSIRKAVAQSRAEKEREQLREQLEVSEMRYRALAESTYEAILGLLEDGTIIFGNEALQRLFDLDPKAVITTNIHEYISIEDSDQTVRLSDISRREIEGTWTRADGYEVPVELSCSPAHKGSTFDFVLVVRDITARKQMEEELRQKQMELIQASKMATLGEMAAGVAHELNQPLNTIKIATNRLRRKTKNEGGDFFDDKLALIESQVDRAAGIIEHMRLFGRKPRVQATEVVITDALEGVFTILGEQLKSSGVEIYFEAEEGLPPVLGEQIRLEQVFLNIIGNAREAMESHERTLQKGGKEYRKRIDIRARRDGNDTVMLSFSDNGCGMPEKVAERVFEPFFTTKEVGQGTGLGMSISYSIIRDFGGRIECSSVENKGTTFSIYLPAVGEDESRGKD